MQNFFPGLNGPSAHPVNFCFLLHLPLVLVDSSVYNNNI